MWAYSKKSLLFSHISGIKVDQHAVSRVASRQYMGQSLRLSRGESARSLLQRLHKMGSWLFFGPPEPGELPISIGARNSGFEIDSRAISSPAAAQQRTGLFLRTSRSDSIRLLRRGFALTFAGLSGTEAPRRRRRSGSPPFSALSRPRNHHRICVSPSATPLGGELPADPVPRRFLLPHTRALVHDMSFYLCSFLLLFF